MPPAGWYKDPAHPARQRWWDGVAWSSQVRLQSPSPTVRAAAPPATHAPSTGPRPVQVVRRPVTVAPTPPVAPAGFALVPVRTTADGVPLASVVRRVIASVLDNVLLSLVIFSVLPVFVSDFQSRFWGAIYSYFETAMAASGKVVSPSDDLAHMVVIVNYALLGGTVAYGLIALMLWSRTLGQRALGIAVTPLDRGKDRIKGPAAFSRTLLWSLLAQGGDIFLLPQLISFGLILWHPKRQSLPDLIARTQVVRRG